MSAFDPERTFPPNQDTRTPSPGRRNALLPLSSEDGTSLGIALVFVNEKEIQRRLDVRQETRFVGIGFSED